MRHLVSIHVEIHPRT